jgi:hypothetical protein
MSSIDRTGARDVTSTDVTSTEAARGESFETVYGDSAVTITEQYEREAPFSYPPLEPRSA